MQILPEGPGIVTLSRFGKTGGSICGDCHRVMAGPDEGDYDSRWMFLENMKQLLPG
jgi:hypothetical protein